MELLNLVDRKLQQSFTVADIKLSYKTKQSLTNQPKIRSSKDAVEVLRTIYDEDTIQLREEFYVLLLNRENRVIGNYKVSEGGISGTVADNKLIFSSALLSAASSIIVSHNHPQAILRLLMRILSLQKRSNQEVSS